jgi:integrase
MIAKSKTALSEIQKPEVKRKPRKAKERGNSTGTFYALPNGRIRWQVTLGFDRDRKQLRASGVEADKTQAQIAMAQAIGDHERGTFPMGGTVALAEYAKKWLEYQKDLAHATRRSYQCELNLALDHLGRLKLRDIKAFHIREALSHLADRVSTRGLGKGRTMSSRTLAHIRTRLRAVFREAVSDGLIVMNPTEAVKRIKVVRTEHPGIALDFDQVAHFQELGEALHAVGVCRLWFALFTAASVGLRRGEVMGLRWCDVDFERDWLHVRQNLTTPGGKLEMRSTKTISGQRDILMPASLKAALARQYRALVLEAESTGRSLHENSPVFATEQGKYTHPDNLDRSLKDLLRWSDPDAKPGAKKRMRQIVTELTAPSTDIQNRTNLEQRMLAIPRHQRNHLETVIRSGKPLPLISPHDLRHTAGTLMLRRGVPIEVVSKTLGHADISLTYRVYRHVLESERRQHVVDLFDTPIPERPSANVEVN